MKIRTLIALTLVLAAPAAAQAPAGTLQYGWAPKPVSAPFVARSAMVTPTGATHEASGPLGGSGPHAGQAGYSGVAHLQPHLGGIQDLDSPTLAHDQTDEPGRIRHDKSRLLRIICAGGARQGRLGRTAGPHRLRVQRLEQPAGARPHPDAHDHTLTRRHICWRSRPTALLGQDLVQDVDGADAIQPEGAL